MPTTHEVLTGTCPCCFGRFVVEGDRTVRHGYKRPGDGHEHGACPGLRFPCYEVSARGCEAMRDAHVREARAAREHVRTLRQWEVGSVRVTRSVRVPGSWETKTEALVLTPASTPEELRSANARSWAEVVENEARKVEWHADMSDRLAATYQDRVDAWKPGLEFVPEARLDADKKAVRGARQEAARSRRDCKRNKALFFYIGGAVSRHRRGQRNQNEWVTPATHPGANFLAPWAEAYPNLKK